MCNSFKFLSEKEIKVLEAIANGTYGSIDEPGGGNSDSADLLGTFCNSSRPGTPFRRLIDIGLVAEYRREHRRRFSWKWEVTEEGRRFLETKKEKCKGDKNENR